MNFKFAKRLLTAVGAVTILAIGAVVWVGPRHPLEWVTQPKQAVKSAQVNVGKTITGITEPMNVLLIGNNARDAKDALSLGTAAGQADILIVAHIDPTSKKVTLLSIPRDALVAMPGWNEPIPKIKSTFELGLMQSPEEGPQLAMESVSKLTGLKIDAYIATYFQGFVDAVDAVGGITVDVPARLYDPEHSGANFQPGLQKMNGEQALAYVRIRQNAAGNNYRTDDYQRQDAELEVLNILKNKLLASGTNLSQLKQLHTAWKKDVATNLPDTTLLGLGLVVSGSQIEQVTLGSVHDSMEIADTTLPGVNKSGLLSDAYYDVLDPQEVAAQLRPFGSIGASTGLPPLPSPDRVILNVYGSQTLVDQLQHAGFAVQWQGESSGNNRIVIQYPPNRLMAACAIGRSLGTANELLTPNANIRVVTVYGP